jgi:DNA-binding NarL/FixJ family response regulator
MARRQEAGDGNRRGWAVKAAAPVDGAVRLFVLRGRRFVAEAVIAALRGDGRLRVVGADTAPVAVIDRLRTLAADVVLVDASDDRERALDGVRRLRDAHPQVKMLAFGVADEVDDAVAFAEAGARACLPRSAAFEELMLAVHELHRERTRCPPVLASRLVARIVALAREEPPRADPAEGALTGRERQVLALLVVGLTNKEIAQRLDVAVATVKNHVHNLLGKLGAHRRQDAVRTAYLNGLVDDFLPCRPKRGLRREVPLNPSRRPGPVTAVSGSRTGPVGAVAHPERRD